MYTSRLCSPSLGIDFDLGGVFNLTVKVIFITAWPQRILSQLVRYIEFIVKSLSVIKINGSVILTMPHGPCVDQYMKAFFNARSPMLMSYAKRSVLVSLIFSARIYRILRWMSQKAD